MCFLFTKLTSVLIKCFLLAMIPAWCHAHNDGAYMRSAHDGFNNRPNWMSGIRDDVMLSELALPGTHDSGTFKNKKHVDITNTQVLNFYEQLRYGIRVFDIRVRHINNAFALHHSIIYLDLNFEDFLQSVQSFLQSSPSETVLFRLKDEYAGTGNTRGLGETLKMYLEKYNTTYFNTQDSHVTLITVRGKFIILSDDHEFKPFGIDYRSFNIQDSYNLSTNWNLYGKWEKVHSQLETAINGDPNTVYINYLSGSGGSFPYFVASGKSSPGTSAPRLSTGRTTPAFKHSYPDFPRVACFIRICTIAFEGTNILTKNAITQYNSNVSSFKRTVGIIMADFPGDLLISTIVNNNIKLRK